MKNKLVFFGTEEFSLPFLQALIDENYEVSSVVTKPDSPRGRSSQLIPPSVKVLAEDNNIPVVQPDDFEQAEKTLSELKPEIGVLAAYGKLLPDAILSVFPQGIVNVHPSDLPKYRGPSPIEATILSGDEQTAVSLITLVSRMDAGPIYAQTNINVPEHISKASLTAKLVESGIQLLVDNLPAIISGQLTPTPQIEAEASYTKLIHKQDGQIEWSKPAEEIERQIRAYMGWPGSFCQLFGVRITINSASLVTDSGKPGEHFISSEGRLGVYCGSGALIIETLQPAGKKPISSADFLRGYDS